MKLPLIASFLLVLGPSAIAGSRTYLNIGDPAPTLAPAKWLKGTPVSSFDKGKVYVVEFWATWCGPCKASIPHLTELAKKFKGEAEISGISIWESNDTSSTGYMKRVESFVKDQGEKMDYNVAVDGPAGNVANAWMKAADEGGIPTTFIVGRDGKIAWIGHSEHLEAVLSDVVEGKFDVEAARARRATEVETTRPIREALADKKFAAAIKLIDAADAAKPEQARMWEYSRLVAEFHVDPASAMTRSDKIIAEANGEIGAYRMVVSIFASEKDLTPAVYRYGKALADKALEKGEMKYLFLAMSAEISSSLGDAAAAVKTQEEAVKEAEQDSHAPKEFVEFLRKNLAAFRAKLPPGG